MRRMGVDVMGISETFWEGSGEFSTTLPGDDDKEQYKIIYSGGETKRRGVAFIINQRVSKTLMAYESISDRIMYIRIKSQPFNLLIIQAYAPCNDASEEDKEIFYEQLERVIQDNLKHEDCLFIIGDFNSKVGNGKEKDIVGLYGLGERNESGQFLVEFADRNNLFLCNTWFQQKTTAQHTWTSPNGMTKNQIDYILCSKRFRNGIMNCKTRTGADCGSDHNPVIAKIQIKLKTKKQHKKRRKWRTERLGDNNCREAFKEAMNEKLEAVSISEESNSEEIWTNLKNTIEVVAEQHIGKAANVKRQSWMTEELLDLMDRRRSFKNDPSDNGKRQYKQLKKDIQRLCRSTKEAFIESKCKELEDLDKTHSKLLHRKIKEFQPTKVYSRQNICNEAGEVLHSPEEIVKRWTEYVEGLYRCEERSDAEAQNKETEEYCVISEEEIKDIIKTLPNNKSCGTDEIPAEFLKNIGAKGTELITKIINKIYNTGEIPNDFLQSMFVPLPKVPKARNCSDYRTISLISHTSKILLNVMKSRITPIIEEFLGESQMGFRKGRGTRDAIFQLQTICERSLEFGKTVYLCFIDYQKAFDMVKHDKLVEVMKKTGIPELEIRLITNLYWKQQAVVKTAEGLSNSVNIQQGVRQGCILSPILFNLYSEWMTKEIEENTEGIKINGDIIRDCRYADDAAMLADTTEKLQKSVDILESVCTDYGMKINTKKTKVMAISKNGRAECKIKIGRDIVEQVSQFKYLGSLLTEDGRCIREVKARIAMAKSAFMKYKDLMKRRINMSLKMKILNTYIFSVVNYAAETWTFTKEIVNKINSFELWCYRRILRISYVDHVSNEEVLRRMGTGMTFLNRMKAKKIRYAGHIMRGSGGSRSVLVLEGKFEGKRAQGRPRRIWTNDVTEWTKLKDYAEMKRTACDREMWRSIASTF